MGAKEEYEEIRGVYRYKKGTRPDQSRDTPGSLRGTTRDENNNLVGHAEFIPDEDSYEYESDYEDEDTYSEESSVEGLATLAAGVLALGYMGFQAFTSHKKQRAKEQPAGWYALKAKPETARYWDGSKWTEQFRPTEGSNTTAPADWYPDPTNANQLRYWDGNQWTDYRSPVPNAPQAVQVNHPQPETNFHDGNHPAQKMTSAQWQERFRAMATAGLIFQSLWYELASAEVVDADMNHIENQRRMRELTPDEGARLLGSFLQKDPNLLDQIGLTDLVRFLSDSSIRSYPERFSVGR